MASMRITLGFLTLLSFEFVALGYEPDFIYPLENVTIAQGRDATFTCVVNNLGGYRVSGSGSDPTAAQARTYKGGYQTKNNELPKVAWIKADTKAILAIHEHVITNNARLSVLHSDFNTWTLIIREVKREDRGQYMCQVNTDPMKSQTAYLEVVIPPDIIYEETSGDIMVPEGGSAKLVCKAKGFPRPKIVWRREDAGEIILRGLQAAKTRVKSVEGEMLSLIKVTRSEMGAYLCIASNGVPPTVSKRMMVHVHFHPLIQVPNQLVGAPTGPDVTLQCHVEASPKAINYWTRESGEMIITSDKYQMTEINSSYYSVQMRLTIRRFNKLDIGGYKCISKNSIGDAEGNIRLYGLDRAGDSRLDTGAETNEDTGETLGNQGSLREAGDGVADTSADSGGGGGGLQDGGEQAAGVSSDASIRYHCTTLSVFITFLISLTQQ